MRTSSAPVFLPLLFALLAACSQQDAPGPPPADRRAPAAPTAPPREVFRLEPDDAGGLRVSGVVATTAARALLLAEVRRHWPGRTVSGDLAIEPDSPAMWVPEAMAIMSYAAAIEDGGLIVQAEGGASGGGVLSITGRVTDDETLARLAADAEASVAPPFTIRTPVDVGLAVDTSAAGDRAEARPVVLAADSGAEVAASDARRALGEASIAFRPGAAHLEPDAVDAITRFATVVAAHPGLAVEVLASGEGTGSPSLDGALAARRAGAVVEALRAWGVDAGRLTASSDQSAQGRVTFRLSVAASN